MPYRNIVVGTDGSATADLAVRHAAYLAKSFGSRLTIVTAFAPQPTGGTADLTEVPEDLKWRITDSAAADERAERAQRIAKEVGVKEIRRRTNAGDPASALIEVAEDSGGDLIVVGSKGMSSPSRFVLGSVPNKVSHHTPCDVMIVHTAK
jgi:nucleotide-binding universal stress UspA family protein